MIPGKIKPDVGTLLLSEPFMQENRFKRSVILLTAHSKEGSVGYILNQKLDVKLGEVIPQCPDSELPLYLGGPVQRDNLFFVHSLGELIDDSIEIKKGIFWGGNFDTLVGLIQRNEIKPENIRLFIGYSGWSPGQLDHELKEKSWIISKAKKHFIFSKEENTLWKNVLKEMGGDYAQMANYPEDPSLN